MKKHLPLIEAFSRYHSMEDIEADYPGIFDPQQFRKHLREHNGEWYLEDKKGGDSD